MGNKFKFYGRDKIYYIYNHILKYLDIIKSIFKVKNIIKIEVAKKYQFNNINKNIKK